jgi:hypothetical protein
MSTIFVQIASYRDTELLPTITDLLGQADHPNDLTFGICWQHTQLENMGAFLNARHFKILSVDYRESKGCCWARRKTQELYNGEDYTLQIDSHMRFVKGWDTMLVEMIRSLDHPKPIISYYPPPYEKAKDGTITKCDYTIPQAITINKFESGFIPYYGSIPLIGQPTATKPILGRFLAAGLLFTIGEFCNEVPYNPNIYFLGEETDLALRSYTKGYNIFHPHKSICWHYFIRQGEPRHWEDHTMAAVKKGSVAQDYVTTTTLGWEQLRRLFWEDNADLGIYSCGKERSRRDFEMFAGFNFKRMIIHPDNNKKLAPITTDPNWEANVVPPQIFKKTIELDLSKVPMLDDYQFWYFGLHDADNLEIYRKDFREKEYLVGRKTTVDIDTTVDRTPVTWVLWPVSASKGWQEKIVGKII